jgi:transcriptional regulator with XRE-family HTH domain
MSLKITEITGVIDRIHNTAPVRWFLREWRKHRGLTLEQVANLLDTTKGFIYDLERGAKRMNDDWMGGLAYVYDIEPKDLLRDPENPTIDDLLTGASLDQRKAVIQFINFTVHSPV